MIRDSEPEPEDEDNKPHSSNAVLAGTETVRVPSKFAKSSFKQEKLKSIGKPVYSNVVVFLIFLGGGCICAAGCGYLVFVGYIYPAKHIIDYTHCKNAAGEKCADIINDKAYIKDGDSMPICKCELEFRIGEDIEAPVGVFIYISNFFQNHRRYIESKDEEQLKGRIYDKKSKEPMPLNKHCKRFDKFSEIAKDGKTVFPCGAIAYSWFSDQFQLFDGTSNTEIPLKNKGIVFRINDRTLFKMPPGFKNKDYSARPPWFDTHFKKPGSWRTQTFIDWWNDGGLENEAFVNWMRVSSHSYATKLFRTVEVPSKICTNNKLCKGKDNFEKKIKNMGVLNQYLNVDFEVTSFKGTKVIAFGKVRHYGSENIFLVYFFGVLAGVAFVLAPLMFFSLPNRRAILRAADDSTVAIVAN